MESPAADNRLPLVVRVKRLPTSADPGLKRNPGHRYPTGHDHAGRAPIHAFEGDEQ
jgi:hypothetical protein